MDECIKREDHGIEINNDDNEDIVLDCSSRHLVQLDLQLMTENSPIFNSKSINHKNRLILVINNNEISSLQGLPNNVVELYARSNHLPDVTGLATISNSLESADLRFNRMVALNGLQGTVFPNCKHVQLAGNLLRELQLSHLASFPVLQVLDLSQNGLRNISALPCMPHLTHLNLSLNQLESVTLEHSMYPSLVQLLLHENKLRAVTLHLEMLYTLDVSQNPIISVFGLETLPRLKVFRFNHCQLQAIDARTQSVFSRWYDLEEIYGAYNGITFETHVHLAAPTVKSINLEHNAIKSLTPFRRCSAVRELILRHNRIRKVGNDPLQDCNCLRVLDLSQNEIEDLSPLLQGLFQHCSNSLTQLDVSDNLVSDVSPCNNLANGLPLLRKLDLRGNPVTASLYPDCKMGQAHQAPLTPHHRSLDSYCFGFKLGPKILQRLRDYRAFLCQACRFELKYLDSIEIDELEVESARLNRFAVAPEPVQIPNIDEADRVQLKKPEQRLPWVAEEESTHFVSSRVPLVRDVKSNPKSMADRLFREEFERQVENSFSSAERLWRERKSEDSVALPKHPNRKVPAMTDFEEYYRSLAGLSNSHGPELQASDHENDVSDIMHGLERLDWAQGRSLVDAVDQALRTSDSSAPEKESAAESTEQIQVELTTSDDSCGSDSSAQPAAAAATRTEKPKKELEPKTTVLPSTSLSKQKIAEHSRERPEIPQQQDHSMKRRTLIGHKKSRGFSLQSTKKDALHDSSTFDAALKERPEPETNVLRAIHSKHLRDRDTASLNTPSWRKQLQQRLLQLVSVAPTSLLPRFKLKGTVLLQDLSPGSSEFQLIQRLIDAQRAFSFTNPFRDHRCTKVLKLFDYHAHSEWARHSADPQTPCHLLFWDTLDMTELSRVATKGFASSSLPHVRLSQTLQEADHNFVQLTREQLAIGRDERYSWRVLLCRVDATRCWTHILPENDLEHIWRMDPHRFDEYDTLIVRPLSPNGRASNLQVLSLRPRTHVLPCYLLEYTFLPQSSVH